jgi:hypothetical protein
MNTPEIIIESILTRHDSQQTVLAVTVLSEVLPGLSYETGRYKISLDALYTDSADPALMAAIAEKLALLPE